MKDFSPFKSPPVYLEIGHSSIKALREGARVELPLERGADGRLTAASREKLTNGLRAFVNKKAMQPRARAYCAINAMGVSVRRLSLPAAARDEFEKVLRLQVEAEFPLSPDELAWGYAQQGNGIATKHDLLVVAVKKDVIEDYADLLSAVGLDPVFTLAALARNQLCPQSGGSHALLDAGGDRPEWVVFEHGIPGGIRILPAPAQVSLPDSVLKIARANWGANPIYLAGATNELAMQLGRRLNGAQCTPLATAGGVSAAILGLKKAVEQNGGASLVMLQNRAKPACGFLNASRRELKPWLIGAAALLCLWLVLPYAEALLLKPLLAKKLAALKADKGRLAMIDHELDFLQSLKQGQPPYLDALYVLAKSAPPGTKFDSMIMNRLGEMTMHGTMQNGAQVTDLRSKLIGSGFFSNVTVEEQTPTPDRQHVNLRMSAHWKPVAARAGLSIGPSADEIMQAKTNHDSGGASGMPPGMPPMMFFPGN